MGIVGTVSVETLDDRNILIDFLEEDLTKSDKELLQELQRFSANIADPVFKTAIKLLKDGKTENQIIPDVDKHGNVCGWVVANLKDDEE